MDTLIGIVGDGFAVLAADPTAARSIVVFKNDEDKILQLDSHKILAAGGPIGDRVNFTEYVQKNIHLYEFRNNVKLTTHAAANWTRNELASSLRTRDAFQVNLLLAGYDKGKGASMYYMDYLGSMHPLKKASHGYGANFCLSTLDRYYFDGMNLDEALDLVKKCLNELKTRFLLSLDHFKIKVVDEQGVREVTLP